MVFGAHLSPHHSPTPPPPGSPRCASALSGLLDARQSATHVARTCAEQLLKLGSPKSDLAFAFFSSHHAHEARQISDILRTELACAHVVGVSCESVLADQLELEHQPGIAALAMSLPGVHLHVLSTDDLSVARLDNETELALLAREAGFASPYNLPHRGAVLLIDPFSVPINAMLPALLRARDLSAPRASPDERPAPILGALASASTRPAGNVLFHNDTLRRAGGLGVSFSGPLRIDALVSQGCKPVGHPMVITGGKGQLISSLAGKPALTVLSELLDSLDDPTKQQVRAGLFVGRAVSEYKERFGRDDFLIRNLIGVDHSTPGGAIAVADLLKVGQTIQFHIRDAKTASEDLALLLDAQQLYDPPAGALLFTCTARGQKLFAPPLGPNHDAALIHRAFAHHHDELAGPTTAKMGKVMSAPSSAMPLAGMFAAGEIGPIGRAGESFVHGQSASLALFRAPDAG